MHNIQSDNLARLKQSKRLLINLGYEVRRDVDSNDGYHSVHLFSYEDRRYQTVHDRLTLQFCEHSRYLPANVADERPGVISTYATVRHSRNTRRRRPSSPVRVPHRWRNHTLHNAIVVTAAIAARCCV